MSTPVKKLTVAVLQLPLPGHDSKINVDLALKAIRDTKRQHPQVQLAILPESFNAPYGEQYFAKYAEPIPDGYACQELSRLAQDLNIYIVGGSIIEKAAGKLYNSCTVWSPKGNLIGLHRKLHLFDMTIDSAYEGGVSFRESSVLSPGDRPVVVEIYGHKVGIGICHDKRFEELARLYRNLGCDMIIYPSAFCICQGPMHWELLQRSRASDNQLFVVTCAPARNNNSGYVCYGHSMIVDPWGKVQREAGISREIMVEELDFNKVTEVRRQIRIFEQRRTDIYDTVLLKPQ